MKGEDNRMDVEELTLANIELAVADVVGAAQGVIGELIQFAGLAAANLLLVGINLLQQARIAHLEMDLSTQRTRAENLQDQLTACQNTQSRPKRLTESELTGDEMVSLVP